MSLSSIIGIASSGVATAQTSLRTVADNISNVNTKGYVRKIVEQSSLTSDGRGQGVAVDRIRQAADAYLERAAYTASGNLGEATTLAQGFDQVQGLFGDPSSETSFFNQLDSIYSGFNVASASPSSGLGRSQIVLDLRNFLSDAARINSSIRDLRSEADTQLTNNIDTINNLLKAISSLNTDIVQGNLTNGDATGSESLQREMIKKLSSYMDIKVTTRPTGEVRIIGGDSITLIGEGAAQLSASLQPSGFSDIYVTPSGGSPILLQNRISSGEMLGLTQLRDRELPGLMNQLGEYTSHAIEELNRAHNTSSSVPAPQTLTGRPTGFLDQATAFSNFSGKTTLAVVDSTTNAVIKSAVIDFTASTISVNGAAPTAFTTATFAADLTAAMGGAGGDAVATFSNGALSITSKTGQGLAFDDRNAVPASLKAGKTFSHYFGMNDLISSTGISTYDTGLQTTSNHGFNSGGVDDVIAFNLTDPTGQQLADITVPIPAGPLMSDLITALNAGVSAYGTFALDTKGRLSFTSTTANLAIRSDSTQRGAGGVSMSALFGIGDVQRSLRTDQYSVRADIVQDGKYLAFAKLDLTVTAGQPALKVGNGEGAKLLANAGMATASFDKAGSISSGTYSISDYAAQFAGSLARASAQAESARKSADAVNIAAEDRRSKAEDVNIDDELIKLTTYTQAFNASARMVRAAGELYDVLLGMVG
ncbi:MAG: flagellar hook-associated protein FlgK [Pseudomonadota bacterium]|jgi:flagellar hook-associated protein 1 FlgK